MPLDAVAGIAYEPGGRKGGRLRLRLREGADPLSQVARGRLPDSSDPYRLPVERDRTGVAEYFVEQVRTALLLAEVLPGAVGRAAGEGDERRGAVGGCRRRPAAPPARRLPPVQRLPPGAGAGRPGPVGGGRGGAPARGDGGRRATRRGGLTRVGTRTGGSAGAGGPVAGVADHDVLLRRLRELGELHRSRVLTDEEFALAKKAVLDRL
ncbi:DUF4429 domain-containing protein [Streptomyces sp. PU-14G]|uniref:DUF4429 domain-containing protein n=1 Tax=Streptomyces sp. PU-14G TaxID=2800808 RepID=UPI0034DFEEDE